MTSSVLFSFDKFIGVDWSGAEGPYVKKLKVAVCMPGKAAPRLVQPTRSQIWRRDDLVDWITRETKSQRVLVGIDFAFAYPYCDKSDYFPGSLKSPDSALTLWQTIEASCHVDNNFYGGRFYKDVSGPFSQYLCYQTYKGLRFDNHRLRETEKACELIGTRPACTFKCVGPDQVGSGSAAGMRVLDLIAKKYGKTIYIWPFDDLTERKSVFVEIFPRLFFILAGRDPQRWRDYSTVNAVLMYFNSEPLSSDIAIGSEDDVDAIVSAAALRNLSLNTDVWLSGKINKRILQYEGWIFGCNVV